MLEQFAKQMDHCTACPRLCQSACPVGMAEANETHTSWGLMQTMNMVRKGELEFNDETAKLSYHCLTCKACTSQCDHEIDVAAVMQEVRRLAVLEDKAPKELAGYLSKFHRHNNPFSRDLLAKLKDIIPQSYFAMDTKQVYFASCTTISKSPEVIKDTFELFEKLKINFVGAYPEPIQCCGYPLYSGGHIDEFIDLAEVNYNTLKKYKTIISGSPTCVYTLKELYKKYDMNLSSKVVSINQFIAPYLNNINYKIRKNIRTKLMYHDPCYLSRYLGEIDLPRDMLSLVSGYEPLEFYNHGEKSGCSGQGGCYSIVNQEASNEIAQKRLEEVSERNVHLLVTQCPSCIHKFRKNSQRLIVKDVISYINDCIDGAEF